MYNTRLQGFTDVYSVNKDEKRIKRLLFIAIFFVFFFPTSLNRQIIDNMWIVRNGIAIVIAFYYVLRYKLSRRPFYVAITLTSLLLLLTCTTSILQQSNDYRIAYASLSGFIPTIMLWCVASFEDNKVEKKYAVKVVDVISIIICIWGIGLVLDNQLALNFTEFFYTQLTDDMFQNMIVLRGKPVMSFGTHSMAAFFVMIVFFFNCVIIREKQESILQYIYFIIFIILEIELSSNTSMLSIVVMAGSFIWAKNTPLSRTIAIIMIVLAFAYFYYTGVLTEFITGITEGVNSESHGFEARYLSGIYNGNFYMATHYFGVGFLRSASNYFRMNDSGIIYIFTQGNIPALAMAYYLMYSFMKRLMSKYHLLTFGLFFIWEFISASTFISVKMVFAQLLAIILINSICSNTESEPNE